MTFSYDKRNRLTQEVNALGVTVSAYAYDGAGNRKTATDARGGVTTFAYDGLNRLIQTTDPPGIITRAEYDAIGVTWRYTLDALGRLTTLTANGGLTGEFTYDAVGNRTKLVDATGTTTYAYDAANHLRQDATPGGTKTYTWAAQGNQLSDGTRRGVRIMEAKGSENELVRLPLKVLRVSRCFVDSAFGLQFFDESISYQATIRIESSFLWMDGSADTEVSVDNIPSIGIALTVLGRTITDASASEEDGSLTLMFSDGARLHVSPDDPRFEAWEYQDSEGYHLVSLPGGRLGSWKA